MGKGTDKLYITHSEWSNKFSEGGMSFGGKREGIARMKAKILPFKCCAVSRMPFKTPVCTSDGIVFDYENILAYYKKYKNNPVTGEAKGIKIKELVKLNIAETETGEYMCPVTEKEFTESSKIVVNLKTGNVYSLGTVEEFNYKAKNMFDLISNEPFTRKDIVVLYDIESVEWRRIEDFWYLKNGIEWTDVSEEQKPEFVTSSGGKINAGGNASLGRILKEIAKDSESERKQVRDEPIKQIAGAKRGYETIYTTGETAASLTSTVVDVVTQSKRIELSEEEMMLAKVSKPSYVTIKTNHGDINVELYCKVAPKTCYNFVRLAEQGKYDNMKVHRLIKHFMVQMGDYDGKGGQSIWGKYFEDEISKKYIHNERGILSMANKGKNTNGSQFFITFRGAKHLDGKHTVFGKVVGGLKVLDEIERVPTGNADIPKTDIVVESIKVLVNSFKLTKK